MVCWWQRESENFQSKERPFGECHHSRAFLCALVTTLAVWRWQVEVRVLLSGSGLEIASVTSAGFVSGIYDEKLERNHLSLFSWSAVMSSLQLRKCSLTRAISTCKFLPSLVFNTYESEVHARFTDIIVKIDYHWKSKAAEFRITGYELWLYPEHIRYKSAPDSLGNVFCREILSSNKWSSGMGEKCYSFSNKDPLSDAVGWCWIHSSSYLKVLSE